MQHEKTMDVVEIKWLLLCQMRLIILAVKLQIRWLQNLQHVWTKSDFKWGRSTLSLAVQETISQMYY